jgi:hypothetical protein
MNITEFSFGQITIDGKRWERDVVIDGRDVRKRKKKPSRKYRDRFGHTPLSVDEAIPWRCKRLIVGTGEHGALPVMDDVKEEAKRREVELLIAPTARAIEAEGASQADERDPSRHLLTRGERPAPGVTRYKPGLHLGDAGHGEGGVIAALLSASECTGPRSVTVPRFASTTRRSALISALRRNVLRSVSRSTGRGPIRCTSTSRTCSARCLC